MSAKSLQICGTGSGVGKSAIVAGFCRIFLQDGFRVAPFKAQNMSLNSFVTPEGGEIGRAQAMQAAACGLKPSVDMNPILLKPTSDKGSQVIVRGKAVRNMSAVAYTAYKRSARVEVLKSFKRLKNDFEVVVIEGAGSPAEINLKSHDIVNMKMAQAADAPVILVGDIDRGGVFAWLIGTWVLLTKAEQRRVKGFIINKFRGDVRLLRPGLDFLEKKTGVKVLGVVPYFKDIKLPEEDSLALENGVPSTFDPRLSTTRIDIAVVKLPHISNFTDFDALKNEPDVRLRYAGSTDELGFPDIIIIPGSKNVFYDLEWLKKTGLFSLIPSTLDLRPSTHLIGICGGYQMLGEKIRDMNHLESREHEILGLGLLPITTVFKKDKVLAQVTAREISSGCAVMGYEIHHGRTEGMKRSRPVFHITLRQGEAVAGSDGSVSDDGRVWGTYIHGVFDSDGFRRALLNRIRVGKGLSPVTTVSSLNLENELDKLALLLRENVDMDSVRGILFGKN